MRLPYTVMDISQGCQNDITKIHLWQQSIDEFLSMNEFIFNVDVCHLQNAVIDEMRTYLKDFFTADGLTIDTGNKVIVIEK